MTTVKIIPVSPPSVPANQNKQVRVTMSGDDRHILRETRVFPSFLSIKNTKVVLGSWSSFRETTPCHKKGWKGKKTKPGQTRIRNCVNRRRLGNLEEFFSRARNNNRTFTTLKDTALLQLLLVFLFYLCKKYNPTCLDLTQFRTFIYGKNSKSSERYDNPRLYRNECQNM